MESNTGPLYGKTPTVPTTWSLIADTFVAPSQLGDMLEAQPAWQMSFAIMACWTCLAMVAIGMREAVIPTIVSITIMLLIEAAIATGVLRVCGHRRPFRFVWAVYVHAALIGSATYYTVILAIVLLTHAQQIKPEVLMPNVGMFVQGGLLHDVLRFVDPVSLWATTVTAIALGTASRRLGYVTAFGQYCFWTLLFALAFASR